MASGKRDDRRREPGYDEFAGARAAEEAKALLDDMDAHIEAVRTFVATQRADLERRPPSPKRLARIRLMSEDVRSAAMFAAAATKRSKTA